jgi:hypothetical protein
MPYEEPEPEDPCELVGAIVPGSDEADEEMAECFIEEFAFLGFGEGRILWLFQQPAYRATYRLWVERGEGWVRERIAAVKARFVRAKEG